MLTSNLNNPNQTITEINELTTTKKSRFNFSRQGITIHAYNKQEYDIITSKLDAANSTYFTHPFKEDKLRHLVLKGLPIIPTQEVQDNLQLQEVKVAEVIRMKQRITTDFPLFMVTLEADQDINKVRKIKYVCLVKIYWENYRNSRRVTQCRRCQLFGHGSSHCRNTPKCMFCAKKHLTEQHIDEKTTQNENEPPKCVNCKGEYQANDANCPVYKRRLEKLDQGTKKQPAEIQGRGRKLPPPRTQQHYPQLKNTKPIS